MGTFAFHRQVIRVLSAAALACSGCFHVHRDADGKFESVSVSAPRAKPKAAEPAPANPAAAADPGVEQASAKLPVDAASLAKLTKYAGTGALPRGAAAHIALTWQRQVRQLPDPVHGGKMIHGIPGQMFLFGSDFKSVDANGKLTVEMFDNSNVSNEETGPRLGTYTFHKDDLRKLKALDERFGKNYLIFIPWPEYKAEVTRLKFTARFEQDHGFELFAPATCVTLDKGLDPHTVVRRSQIVPGSMEASPNLNGAGFSNMPALSGIGAAPSSFNSAPSAPLDPLPIGGRSATAGPAPNPNQGGGLPPNLPPLVFTIPRK